MRATVIDLGIGNLGNVERALRSCGAEVSRARSAADLAEASAIVMPGVGAFRPPRERLRGELEQALRERLAAGAFLLGICVGFQLLFESSAEFGDTDGLGLIPGVIEELPSNVELPHMGWNRLLPGPAEGAAKHPLVADLENVDQPFAYFVHSFAPARVAPECVLLEAEHGRRFAAGVARDRIFGFQFHPEKSDAVGLELLGNFLQIAAGQSSAGMIAGDRS